MSQQQEALVQRIEREWNSIRGRILGLIESWGLPDTQEAGAKQAFKALASTAQDRMTQLVSDDGLRTALNTVTQGIDALTRFRDGIADERAAADAIDRPAYGFALSLADERLAELRTELADLQHLERVQASLGRAER